MVLLAELPSSSIWAANQSERVGSDFSDRSEGHHNLATLCIHLIQEMEEDDWCEGFVLGGDFEA